MKIHLYAIGSSWLVLGPALAGEPKMIHSPDQAFVVSWFDTDLGKPIAEVRSIFLIKLSGGEIPFSLVTFPRSTLASWSPDSRRCVIVDAPDNGNTNVWLFTANAEGEQAAAIPIDPLKELSKDFHQDSRGKQLYRPGITSVTWQDDLHLIFDARDNKGVYRITLAMDALGKPMIERR